MHARRHADETAPTRARSSRHEFSPHPWAWAHTHARSHRSGYGWDCVCMQWSSSRVSSAATLRASSRSGCVQSGAWYLHPSRCSASLAVDSAGGACPHAVARTLCVTVPYCTVALLHVPYCAFALSHVPYCAVALLHVPYCAVALLHCCMCSVLRCCVVALLHCCTCSVLRCCAVACLLGCTA